MEFFSSVHTGLECTSPTVLQFCKIMRVVCRIWNRLLNLLKPTGNFDELQSLTFKNSTL